MTTSRPVAFEPSDAASWLIAVIAGGFAAFIFATPFLMVALFPTAPGAERVAGVTPQPPAPRLQPDPRLDLAKLRREETEWLNTYGWVDRAQGVVRIPIERAMELTAARGIPHWNEKTPSPPIPPRAAAQR
jgi:hypothetical protein